MNFLYRKRGKNGVYNCIALGDPTCSNSPISGEILGFAKRDISSGEILNVRITPNGSFESDAISFQDGAFADLYFKCRRPNPS